MQFWTTLCQAETEQRNTDRFKNIIGQFKDSLLPIIWQALCITEFTDDEDSNVEESPDEVAWTVSRAAGTFLTEAALLLGDNVVQETLTFAHTKMQGQSWQENYIGLIALGSICEGPSADKIAKEFDPAFPLIVKMLSTSQSSRVRQAAAWVIS